MILQARVHAVYGVTFLVFVKSEEYFVSAAKTLLEAPVVGDFVSVQNHRIIKIDPRSSAVSRRAPGSSRQVQVLCANIDWFFVVSGLDHDFNLRRLERYLVIGNQSGARTAFVLTKADLCTEPEARVSEVREIAGGAPVILSSAVDGLGAKQIGEMLAGGLTGAMVGSSGVGKSTLLNLLEGEQRQAVQPVREGDSKGRHTTTSRQMFAIPGGGWMIDQPGMREIQLAVDKSAVYQSFSEIAELAVQCRFRDCRHESEPGCAVRAQVGEDRLQSFGKLRREAERNTEADDPVARSRRKSMIKSLHKQMRGHYRD